MFSELMKDRVTIRTADGTVHEDVRASVQGERIFTERTDIPVRPGDTLTRSTPAGVEEVFVVVDPGLHAGLSGFPSTYQMRVRRADAPPVAVRSSGIVYNVTGPNARLNINSIDSSTNVVDQAPAEFFKTLREAIRSHVPAKDREALIERADALEKAVGQKGLLQRYAEFMELAAHHVEVLTPFLPAIAQLAASHVKI
jgi:hypothetical protein